MTPCIIAIAGPSGSGKSLFAQTLVQAVREAAPGLRLSVIAEDAYYRDQSHLSMAQREAANYDHPDALDQALLCDHLKVLRAGRPVAVPVYDYTRHTRSAQTREVAPAPVILVEGILLLANPSVRPLFDIRFYVDTPLDLCLLRRIERDLATRGRTLASITRQYEQSVRPMYHAFVRPSAEHADMVITGGGRNTVAVDVVRRLVQTHAAGAADA